MRLKSILLSAGLMSLLVTPAFAADEDTATAIISVTMVELDNKGTEVGGSHYDEFTLMNMQTHKTYFHTFRHNSFGFPYVLKLKPGIYCFNGFETANTRTTLCGEPYFKVEDGTVNNLGWWRFGVSWSDWKIRLLSAIQNTDEVYEHAFQHNPELFPAEAVPAKP